jgi:hypothetical protein
MNVKGYFEHLNEDDWYYALLKRVNRPLFPLQKLCLSRVVAVVNRRGETPLPCLLLFGSDSKALRQNSSVVGCWCAPR